MPAPIFFTFWILLVPLLIILAITYFRSKQFYPLMYILGIFSYVNLIAYIIGAYTLQKNGIILTLTVSALFMIFIGYRMSRKRK